jgi:hypothetical protein
MEYSKNLTVDVSEHAGGKKMENLNFDKDITALLVIDPYNEFISEGCKVWDRLKTVAQANDCIPHMLQVLNAARKCATSRLLRAPSSLPCWRLRELEVHCAYPEGRVVAQGLRIRHLGWRNPQ